MAKPWRAYRVTLRVVSPLHLGWRTVGNLQQTRLYVTGRVLWGALTARLARDAQIASGAINYATMGEQVDDMLAFTYLYPSIDKQRVTPWPWRESRDEFAWTFLSSYVSTAIGDGYVATAGSLHETECIATHGRVSDPADPGRPVYLLGYVFSHPECTLDWQRALDSLVLGGERSYGWGRVALVAGGIERVHDDDVCFRSFKPDLYGGRPALVAREDAKLLAHTACSNAATHAGVWLNPQNREDTDALWSQSQEDSDDAGDVSDDDGATEEMDDRDGDIEPFIGRETADVGSVTNGGFGARRSTVSICWTPGSACITGERFYIGPRGIWHAEPIAMSTGPSALSSISATSTSRRADKRKDAAREQRKRRKGR